MGKHYVTIDPYYPSSFYNECKQALKNNQVRFTELISTKPPYYFYFELDDKPLMVNYDELPEAEQRWLVTLVKPIYDYEEYLLTRRNEKGINVSLKFIENEPLREARQSRYACFFNIRNRAQITQFSRESEYRIWYLGAYYNNKIRLGLTCDPHIKDILSPDNVLLEKSANSEIGRFESELNFNAFYRKDRLIKYTMTPYAYKGGYNQTLYRTYRELP